MKFKIVLIVYQISKIWNFGQIKSIEIIQHFTEAAWSDFRHLKF